MPRVNDYTLRDSAALQDADNFLLDTPSGVFRTRLQDIKAVFVDAIYPVGSFYTQYPDAENNDDAVAFPTAYRPATLFGGTWVAQFDTEAVVFETGGDDTDRTTGLQPDAFQGHYHQINGTGNLDEIIVNTASGAFGNRLSAGDNGGVSFNLSVTNPRPDGTSGTPRTADRTRHKNRKIKVWKRTA